MLLSPPSPAEELYFGNTESGEKKTLIVLTNVTKNIVAFKVNILKDIINYVSKFDMESDFRCILIERLIVLNLHNVFYLWYF